MLDTSLFINLKNQFLFIYKIRGNILYNLCDHRWFEVASSTTSNRKTASIRDLGPH
jgi:hypothetical protein